MIKTRILTPVVIMLLAGCSAGIGASLDKSYEDAYQQVLKEPSADNVARYMELSDEKARADMKEAESAANAAQRKSDVGFTQYFKRYGSDSFKKRTN